MNLQRAIQWLTLIALVLSIGALMTAFVFVLFGHNCPTAGINLCMGGY